MARVIDVPGHGEVEFPDSMSDDQIVAAIKKNLLAPRQKSEFTTTEGGAAMYSPQQMRRTMGVEKQGNTIEGIRNRLDTAAYDVGGAVTDTTGSPALGYAANVATEAVPALLGGGGGKAVEPAAQAVGKRVMQSALKPTWESLRTGKAAKAIETMLEDGYNATKGGVEAMKSKIADLNDEISQAISNSTARIDKGAVADRLRDTLKKFEMQVNPNSDVNAITNAWSEFINHPLLTGARDMTVQTAQKLKQGTYKALGNKSYGELKGADVEAQKALARGLKEEISAAVPETAALNAKEGSLINASNVAERRAMLQDNNNIGGLVWLSHDLPAAAGFMADKSSLVKSLIARGIYSGSPTAGAAAGGILGSLTSTPDDEGILSRRTTWVGKQ